MLSKPPRAETTPERLLQRLEWKVIRRLDGLLQGDYRTLFYGHGIDFADLREYQPGDDIRHMDWNVTARMDTPFVRSYIEDREVTAWFLLDLSRSMGFGPAERPKESVLIDLVTTLARLLTRGGNRVGAILYSGTLEPTISPGSSRMHVLRLVHTLLYDLAVPVGTATDLKILLGAGLNTIQRRSLVFLLSDFFSEPGWAGTLSQLNRRHELVAIRLWDPHETQMPDAGFVVLEDSETGEQEYVDTSQPEFRRRFQEAAAQHEAQLNAGFQRAGVDAFSISTQEDLVTALVRMAGLRKRRRRRAGRWT